MTRADVIAAVVAALAAQRKARGVRS